MLGVGKHSWRPRHKARERRRKQLMWKVGIGAALFLLLVGGLAFASHHSSITVQEIIVSGNKTLLDDELRDTLFKRLEGRYGFLFARSNILLYSDEALTAAVMNTYPRVKEATVDTKNLHTIELSIVEREPFALWCGESPRRAIMPCYFLDAEGFIFTEAPSFTNPLFFVYYGAVAERPLGSQYLTVEEFRSVAHFITLVEDLGLEPVTFIVREGSDAEIVVDEGGSLYIDREDNLLEVFERLESVVTSDAFDQDVPFEYIDLRFGNKVYYTVE